MALLKYILNFILLISTIWVSFCDEDLQDKDPEHSSGYFDGDIILDNGNTELRDPILKWPNKIVYYRIDYPFGLHKMHLIMRGISKIEAATCLRFKQADKSTKAYINITGQHSGCFSALGYANSVRILNLGFGCFRIGKVEHQFLHALGILHMHNRPEREKFISIMTWNVKDGLEKNFNIYKNPFLDNFNIEYDYNSLMHFDPKAFSKNGRSTIHSKYESKSTSMGQRRTLTKKDINRINFWYGCAQIHNLL